MTAEAKADPKGFDKVALLASPTERAQEAAAALNACRDWAPIEEADATVVLGGDGFMLEAMHRMIDSGRMVPVYGLNLGTVGFLMNRYQKNCRVLERMAKAPSPARSRASMPSTRSRCCARRARLPRSRSASTSACASPSWLRTACCWRRRSARPRTTIRPAARSCRSIRRCSR